MLKSQVRQPAIAGLIRQSFFFLVAFFFLGGRNHLKTLSYEMIPWLSLLLIQPTDGTLSRALSARHENKLHNSKLLKRQHGAVNVFAFSPSPPYTFNCPPTCQRPTFRKHAGRCAATPNSVPMIMNSMPWNGRFGSEKPRAESGQCLPAHNLIYLWLCHCCW